jgi:hypothetical protein
MSYIASIPVFFYWLDFESGRASRLHHPTPSFQRKLESSGLNNNPRSGQNLLVRLRRSILITALDSSVRWNDGAGRAEIAGQP